MNAEPRRTRGGPDMSRAISGERATKGSIGLRDFLILTAQLALVLLLFRQFQIESAAFLRLSVLAFAGFTIHAFLPLPYRFSFFALLSLAGIGLVMGLVNGAWLLAIGLVLIAICHLPLALGMRVSVLAGIGAILIAQRASLIQAPWSQAIWPILGSMFMFRLLVYLYDLEHERTSSTWSQRLAYFFMLPNACFPLFPVVDYKTFRTNYYDDDAYRTYQIGVDWIVRGVVHLLLYRVFYYHLTLAPHEVTEPAQLMQYLVSNFMLYLRVSGLFHLVVGMLHLFGYRLPETHNRYLLASSFTDFWRRINIYWKDFMQKLFYYPAVFKLRKLGTTQALVIATLYVFLMTWFLHAYQWFWLRGTMLLVYQDVLFWAILGVLVVFNSLYEIKYGRKRTLGKQERSWKEITTVIIKTYATFWFITILWSFWTAENLADWFSLWSALKGSYTAEFFVFPLTVLLVIAVGSVPRSGMRNVRATEHSNTDWLQQRAATIVALVVLITLSIEGVSRQFGAEVATFVHSLRSGQLSRLDTAKLERGYYENLLSVDRFNSQLWEVYTNKPSNWLDVENANIKRFVAGFQRTELIPSFVFSSRYGPITINRLGMRDQDYADMPTRGTHRAVVLGASSVMGWGVADGQTFEALIEKRLNSEQTGARFQRYELLNMAVPGYEPPQQLLAFDKALHYQPHAVYYVATGREIRRSVRYLANAVRDGLEIPFEPLRQIVQSAQITKDMDEVSAVRALSSSGAGILLYIYQDIVEKARNRGIVPVWIFLPQVRQGDWVEETPETVRIAKAAGFVVINMDDVYKGLDIASIRLAEWDHHPNVLGHEITADRLYRELMARREQVFTAARY